MPCLILAVWAFAMQAAAWFATKFPCLSRTGTLCQRPSPFRWPPVVGCNLDLAVCTCVCPLFDASFACEICPLIDQTCIACSSHVACNARCSTVCRCLEATVCSIPLSSNTVYRLSGSSVCKKLLMWCKCTYQQCPVYARHDILYSNNSVLLAHFP